jgi:3-isopropylmalate/(R)-2-methylmalate dehydratase small subunit
MENLDPEFRTRVQVGDVIVARKNYGCGSSREHAPIAIKANGISCVIADSFARIFFRNAINLALPLVECAEVAAITETGDDIEVDLAKGIVTNQTKGQSFSFKRYPESMMEIVDAGGLIEYTRRSM